MQRPINVFQQKTPNPNAYKFPTSVVLVPDGAYEVRRSDLPTGLAPVDQIFANWPVERVYVANNFLTVIKPEAVEWFECSQAIRDYIAEGLRDGVLDFAQLPQHFRLQTQPAHAELNEFFARRILPATEQDGGGIFLKSFENGEMHLVVAGACTGCPHAQQTIQKGIVEPLHGRIAQVKRVLVNEASRMPGGV
jgi:NFU1 iron-sulfur cluster scaffold homolog, mitochondrial